jgi:hypothetical protein
MSQSDFHLRVETSDKVTEIAVIDARQNPVANGVGLLDAALPKGLYKVRARLGPAIQEQLLSLDQDRTVKISEGDFQFPTPVPLEKTARSHEYHQMAAIDASQMTPVDRGAGANILVFARDWSPNQKTTGNPMLGLTLHDAAGTKLLLNMDEGADLRQLGDVSAGNRVSVNPGAYRLRLTLANGRAFERILIAVQGWQTQIFLFLRDYHGDHRSDLAGGAVVMAGGPGNPNGIFDPRGRGERVAVIARYALTQNRRIADAVYQELFDLKFSDPILGLLAAHLLLRDEPDKEDVREEVMHNVRGMLGPGHPDVQALELRSKVSQRDRPTLQWPPMLRASWDLVTEESLTRPTIIPLNSILESMQTMVTPSAPWLTWRTDGATEEGEDDTLSAPERNLATLKAFVAAYGRSELSKSRAAPAGSLESLQVPMNPQASDSVTGLANLKAGMKVELTRSLGVTGAALDAMLRSAWDDSTKTGP